MYFRKLYQYNLIEMITNAKEDFIPLRSKRNSGRYETDYFSPFSWAIGIIKCIFSPVAAFFKTCIDVLSRNISERDRSNAIKILQKKKK